MVDKLYELLGEDRISVELYPAQQRGNLREQAEATQMGDINITMQPVSTVTPFVDDIKVIDFPYLLPADREKIFEVLDGDLGREALDRLEQGQFESGFLPRLQYPVPMRCTVHCKRLEWQWRPSFHTVLLTVSLLLSCFLLFVLSQFMIT